MRKFGMVFGHMRKELIEAYAPIINDFTKSRDISCKDDGGATSFRHLRKPGYSWQLAKEPLPYFHVVYGFAPENCTHPGSPTLISAYSGDGGFTYRGKDWFAQGDEVVDE